MKTHYFLTLLFLFAFGATGFSQEHPELERRAYLGVKIIDISPKLQQFYRMTDRNGVVVTEIISESSAELADIRTKDVIFRMNDADVSDASQFLEIVRGLHAGDEVRLSFFRDGKAMSKKVLLDEVPYESNPNFETIYTSIEYKGNVLRTIVTKPFGEDAFPAVLLVQNEGCYSMEFPFLDHRNAVYGLVDSLTQAGFATVRVESVGTGDSTGPPCNPIDFVDDLGMFKKAYKDIQSFTFIDAENIFVMGFSIPVLELPSVVDTYEISIDEQEYLELEHRSRPVYIC